MVVVPVTQVKFPMVMSAPLRRYDQERFFVTWGRVQDEVDGEPLESIVLRHADAYDLGGRPTRARVCVSLQEAWNELYFFEALFDFAQQPIPFGDEYPAWRTRIAAEMEQGRHLYYLGR